MPRQFIEPMSSLWRATDENAWFEALALLGRKYGFDHTLYAVLPRPGMRFSDAYIRSTYDANWRQTYDERALFRIDPTVRHCLRQTSPLLWTSSHFSERGQQEMYEEACQHGLCAGISLPIHGPKQEVGMLCLVRSDSPGHTLDAHVQHSLPMLTLLRDVAFDTSQRFLDGYTERLVPKLTPREYECLKWTAQGKSTWEIAKIFGCSEATVNFHMTNIRGKFGVSSRSAAAVKATRMGLIDPD
jgi:LuxR family quorum-sensing transcriptional regulator LasR